VDSSKFVQRPTPNAHRTTPIEQRVMNEKKYWNRWYIAVTAFLLLQILAFYFITKKFA
jgi:hypothetical protein